MFTIPFCLLMAAVPFADNVEIEWEGGSVATGNHGLSDLEALFQQADS